MGDLCGQSVDTRSPVFAILNDDPQIIAQWITLCLSTTQGFCFEAPEYGFDLRQYVLRPLTADDLAILPTQISHALTYNQQIKAAEVTVARTFTGGGAVALGFTIAITPQTIAAAPFTLVGTASAELISIVLQGSDS